jgi:hypothetical protein
MILPDLAGNVTNNGNQQFQYDAESTLISVNSGAAASYVIDPTGNRVRKNVGSNWTEYVYFGDQLMAEKNTDGSWSDYIYANRQRIVKADSSDIRIHTHGTTPGGAGSGWSIPGPSYTVKQGDQLMWSQFQSAGYGGLNLQFSDGTQTAWNLVDSQGQQANVWHTLGTWGSRRATLNNFAGKAIINYQALDDTSSPAGTYDIYYNDIAIISTDGTVTPIYHRQLGASLPNVWNTGQSGLSATEETLSSAQYSPQNNNTYYHGDHLSSTRMLTAGGGWPISSDSTPSCRHVGRARTLPWEATI